MSIGNGRDDPYRYHKVFKQIPPKSNGEDKTEVTVKTLFLHLGQGHKLKWIL